MHEDNHSAISMTKNPQFHDRAKLIDIKYHFVREQVGSGKLELKYCKTNDMIADIQSTYDYLVKNKLCGDKHPIV